MVVLSCLSLWMCSGCVCAPFWLNECVFLLIWDVHVYVPMSAIKVWGVRGVVGRFTAVLNWCVQLYGCVPVMDVPLWLFSGCVCVCTFIVVFCSCMNPAVVFSLYIYLSLLWIGRVCTFVTVVVVYPVEVVDGAHRVELDLSQISVTDPVELRGGLGGRRPWHLVSSQCEWTGESAGSSGIQTSQHLLPGQYILLTVLKAQSATPLSNLNVVEKHRLVCNYERSYSKWVESAFNFSLVGRS